MKEVKRKMNRIFAAGAALALVGGILLAPLFVDAGFFDKAKEEDPSVDVGCSEDEITYSYGGEYYCLDTAECSSDAECGAGQMCLVKKGSPIKKVDVNTGKTVTRIPAVTSCVEMNSIDALCKTDADCTAKTGKGFDDCKGIAPQWQGNYFIDAQCVKAAAAAKGCCTLLSDGSQYKEKTEAECFGIAGGDSTQIAWKAGDCVGAGGTGTGSGVCATDKDCLNNLICGGATVVGSKVTKQCVAEKSLAGGAQCTIGLVCATGVCGNIDAKTLVGQCTAAASTPITVDVGKIEPLDKTACESHGGEWVDGAGKNGKGVCYAKTPPISLTTEIGGKTQVKGLGEYLLTVVNVTMALGAGFAVLMIMVGGFMYMGSGGNPAKVTVAKQYGFAAVAGLVLIVFSYVLLNTINPALIKMKPIAMPIVTPISMTCCVKGTAPSWVAGKCPSGTKEVKDEMCLNSMAFGAPCCVNKAQPGNSEACHKIGGICINAEKMDKSGACTKIAETIGITAAMGVSGGVIAAEATGQALLSSAAKGGAKILQWVGKGSIKVISVCLKNLGGCLVGATGVAAGYALSDLASGFSCTEENMGICMEANVPLANGDMCKDGKQCSSGICCMTMDSLGCWGGGAIGFCSNGKPGRVADGGVGTCKFEDPKSACCKSTDSKGNPVSCRGAQVGSSMLGYCSAGQEGEACAEFKGGGWWTGYKYETTGSTFCAKGLKCNSAGICVSETTQKTAEGDACKKDGDCPLNAWCPGTAGEKVFCSSTSGPAAAYKFDDDPSGCVTDASGKCSIKEKGGEYCVNDRQCQTGLCVVCNGGSCLPNTKICSYGEDGSPCDSSKNCLNGLVCGDGKCAHIDIGKACNTNADCATGDCESGFAGDKCVCTDNEQCIAAYGADYNVCTDKDYDYHYCKTDAGDWKGPVNNPVQ